MVLRPRGAPARLTNRGTQGVAFGQLDDLGTPVSQGSRGSITRPTPAAPQRFACRLAATGAWFTEEVAVTLSSCRDLHPATVHQLAWRTQLTLMAGALYRLLGRRLGHGLEIATPRTLFRKIVRASATIESTADEVVVTLGRRAHNPLLLEAGYADTGIPAHRCRGSTTAPCASDSSDTRYTHLFQLG